MPYITLKQKSRPNSTKAASASQRVAQGSNKTRFQYYNFNGLTKMEKKKKRTKWSARDTNILQNTSIVIVIIMAISNNRESRRGAVFLQQKHIHLFKQTHFASELQ